MEHHGDGAKHNQTRIFFNGGESIWKIKLRAHMEGNKPYNGTLSVRRASRIDNGHSESANGPTQWGIVISGIYYE
jgi:hypothetical protein